MIYLDNAATTRMDLRVQEVVAQSMERDFGNAGTVYRMGLDAKKRIDQARESIAQVLCLPSHFRVIFTSGGSEANNLFIKGLCSHGKRAAGLGLEHPSVSESLSFLAASRDETLMDLSSYQKEGRLGLSAVPSLKENNISLLCLSHVNNELGSVNDPVAIAAELKKNSPKTRLFLDGVQAVGKRVLAGELWSGLAGYSVSGHKINGPKGIGLLLYDSRLTLVPQIHGGKQQWGVRSGTLPTPLILGIEKALQLAVGQAKESEQHYRRLSARLINGLSALSGKSGNLNIKFNSLPVDDTARQSPSIVNFSFWPVEGEVVLHHLEAQDIFVGLGSACSAQSKEPSKIITAIGVSVEEARCSLRISFGPHNTLEEIDRFLAEFNRAYVALYPTFSKNNPR